MDGRRPVPRSSNDSMDDGTYLMLELGEDYSGAVWSRKPLELRWEHAEVQLP